MKQKYFVTFLFSFGFILTFGQNNAISITGNNGFYFSGPNGTSDYHLNLSNFTVEYDFYLNAPSNENARFSAVAPGFSFVPKPIDFYINGTGNSILTLGDGTNTETIPGTPSFLVGQWYHVAFAVNNIPIDQLRNNTALVAGASKIFKVPTIVTTVAEKSFSGPVFKEIEEFYPQKTSNYIDRTTMNTWEDENAYKAIKAKNKKKI